MFSLPLFEKSGTISKLELNCWVLKASRYFFRVYSFKTMYVYMIYSEISNYFILNFTAIDISYLINRSLFVITILVYLFCESGLKEWVWDLTMRSTFIIHYY